MNVILHETESLCPVCLRRIPARYERRDGRAYFTKACPEHGGFSTLFWRDADMYESWLRQGVHAPAKDRGRPPDEAGCPFSCGLCDAHRSGTCTAVIELTYRCDLDCRVCFADANSRRFEPGPAQLERMYAAALASNRFCSIQLSGGEPTMREDLPDIIRLGKRMGAVHLQLNTNGLRLAAEPGYAAQLKAAGLDLVYLQFDGLDDAVYRRLRGRDLLELKLKAIARCEAAGLGVLLVPVVVPGVNLDSLGEIVRFGKAHIPFVKGVHFQPMSCFGRFPGGAPADEERCGLCDVIHALCEQCPGELRLEHFVPRKQFDPHCDFSSTYFLDAGGRLAALSERSQNDGDTERTDFVEKTNKYTQKRWRYQPGGQADTALGRFALRTLTHSFCISGMGFQDVWNLDLGRLRGCCVHVVTADCRLVPFCAFHLTDEHGGRLYEN